MAWLPDLVVLWGLWCGLVVLSCNVTQQMTPAVGSQNAEFVFKPDLLVKETLAAQPLDAVPATVFGQLVVGIFVLVAEQQDVEISAQQAAAYGVQVLDILLLHVPLQTLAHVEHGRTPF